jgi:hypothetical protein
VADVETIGESKLGIFRNQSPPAEKAATHRLYANY